MRWASRRNRARLRGFGIGGHIASIGYRLAPGGRPLGDRKAARRVDGPELRGQLSGDRRTQFRLRQIFQIVQILVPAAGQLVNLQMLQAY